MTGSATRNAPATSVEVRARLVEALGLDLVGPGPGHALAEERLPGWVRPSNWYLTGFLIPTGTPLEKRGDVDEDDDFELVPGIHWIGGRIERRTEGRKERLLPLVNGPELSRLPRHALHLGDSSLG